MLHLRRERDPSRLPLAAMLACPVVDIAALCEEVDVDAEYCILSKPMMHAIGQSCLPTPEARAAWRRSSSALNPGHDLSQLPPVFVQAGQRDYLFSQAQTLVKKAREIDGASNWELDVHEDMPHIFTSFPAVILPSAKVGIQRMAKFAANCVYNRAVQNSKAAETHTTSKKQQKEPAGA